MPVPTKKKGQTSQQRISQLIRFYIREGRKPKVAQAIAYSTARKEGRKLPKQKAKRKRKK